MQHFVRFLSLTLCLCLLCSLLPPVVIHATTHGDLTYSISDGKVTITDCYESASGELVIPNTIEGYPVTGIGYRAFYSCTSLTSVTIPDSVSSIGDWAFSYCTGLTSVTIPNSVTSIGEYAFSVCDSLSSVTIPDSVTSIGAGAFCSGIIVSENNPSYSSDTYGVLFNKGQTLLIKAPEGISGAYTIPDSVTSIENNAFSRCTNLTSVMIPDGVTSIGKYAFSTCKNLTGVTIPDSVTGTGEYAFCYCYRLTSVTIPDSVTSIGEYVFSDCKSLTDVTIPDSVTSIGKEAFSNCKGLTGVTIPDSVTSIGEYAFFSCDNLADISFTGNAPRFGASVFRNVFATLWYHAGTTGWDTVTSNQLAGGYGRITLQEADHVWSEYTYDNNHTCTADGTERAVCLTCGETVVRKVEGTAGHRVTYTSNNDATCSQDGTKTGVCKVCGVTETVTDGGSVLGHAYSDFTSNNDATCTLDGTLSAVCATCGDVKTVTDEGTALGHSFTNYISDGNFTCTVDGTETAKCDRCDATDWREAVGSAAHRYVDGSCLFCDKPAPGPNCAGLTGTLVAYGTGEVRLTLTPVGETVPAATLTTADGSYSLAVDPGDYILTVSQEGAVARTYTLNLTEGETILEVKIACLGDVNGDGRLNVGDVAMIYAHAKHTALLTDDYQLLCADYNGDGRINVGDTATVYAYAKRTA